MKKTILIAFFSLFGAMYATAQNNSDTLEMYISTIDINVNKRVANVQKLDASVTAFNLKEIENQQVQNISNLSMTIPNMFMPDYGIKLSPPTYIRGIGAKINSPAVSLYVDGIPFFEKSAFDYDFYDAKQVVILRGPQGTLYGRNSMAGVIDITTIPPSNELSGRFSAEYGSYNHLKLVAGISTPIIKEKLYAKVSASSFQRDGIFFNTHTHEPVDFLNENTANFQLLYNPFKNLTVRLNTSWTKMRDGGYGYEKNNDIVTSPYQIAYNDESFYNKDRIGASLKAEYLLANSVIRYAGSLYKTNDLQTVDQDFSVLDLYSVRNDGQNQLQNNEIIWRSENTNNLEWILGTSYFRQNLINQVDVNYGTDFSAPMNTFKTSDRTNTGAAVFGEISYKNVLPGLNLTAGIRLDHEESALNYIYDREAGGVRANVTELESKLNDRNILPKFSASYTIDSNTNVYAGYTEGFRAGGFNTTFAVEDEKSYLAEKSKNYEVGSKTQFKNFRLNVSAFYIDWVNQQIYQPPVTGTGQILKNAGKSNSKGAEIEMAVVMFKNLNINLSGGYTDAKFETYTKGEDDYAGTYVPFAPKYTYSILVNYKHKFNMEQSMNVSLHNTGIGEHYWVEYTDHETSLKHSAYGLLNAKIKYDYKNYSLSFWGKNLGNVWYKTYEFTMGSSQLSQLGKPRMLGISVSANF